MVRRAGVAQLDQRRASIETDEGLSGHKRAGGRALVLGGIGHHNDLIGRDGVATGCQGSGDLLQIRPFARFDDLLGPIDERLQGCGLTKVLACAPKNLIQRR